MTGSSSPARHRGLCGFHRYISVGVSALFTAGLIVSALPGDSQADPLTEPQKRGKRIYATGQGTDAIIARLSGPGIDAAGKAFPCIQCHKEGGEGAREGGVLAPDITPGSLTLAQAGIRLSGREHPPYDDTALARAIREGVDPAGNALHPAMPRYTLAEGDLGDLLAYLKVLGSEPVPGVDGTRVRIGILKPVTGPLAPAGQAVATLLAGYFEEQNALGGLYGRDVQLVALEFDPAAKPQEMVEAVRRHLAEDPVFCFVGNLGVPDEHPVARFFAAEGIPVFAPLTIHAQSSFASDSSTFFIHSSLYDQARVLVDFFSASAKDEPGRKKIALVHAEDIYGKGAAAGVREQSPLHGLTLAADFKYPPNGFDADNAAKKLKAQKAEAVFFFGAGADMRSFVEAADAQGWKVPVFGLAELAGGSLLSLSSDAAGRVILASPLHVPDPGSPVTKIFYRLLEKYSIPTRYSSFLSSSFAGIRLLEEGMKRAGRGMTRARLVQEVGGLWQFETGMTPNLSYNENRRTGLTGASLLGIDSEKKQYHPVEEWREPLALTERK